MVNITKYLISAGNITLLIVVVLLILVLFAILGWWIYKLIKYNKRTIIRTVTGNNVIIQTDWSKEYKDKKDGVYYWKLKKRKHKIPRPPSKALDVTNTGKEWVELYYIGQGQYVPCKADKPDFSQNPEFVNTFQPITESQRQTYADQMEKSLGFKTKNLWDFMPLIAPGVVLILMLVVFMLFFGDVTQPIAEMADKTTEMSKEITANIAQYAETQNQIMERL